MVTSNPSHAAYQAGGRRHARSRASYSAVARQMGGAIERGDGYAIVTFPAPGEAEAYASWLRKVRRRQITYTGGTAVTVRL